MRSVRKRIRAAVLAALPAISLGCPASSSRGASGSATSTSASSTSSSATGGTTGFTSSNLCTECVAQEMECNAFATGCQPPCTDCACDLEVEPVVALDGGFPDGGLPIELCRAACSGGVGTVWACGVLDGGCRPASLGTLCVQCLVEGCPGFGGRRPEGFLSRSPRGWVTPELFLAQSAELEAASVLAFGRMRCELAEHGAPESLVRRAQRAVDDERLHARLIAGLARAHGAAPRRVPPRRFGVRSLEAFAQENAVEGAVHETLGAAVAAWQSVRASSPQVRSLMRRIAEDESRHASLAWDADAWVVEQLSDGARRRVRAARDRAVSDWVPMPFSPTCTSELGLPDEHEQRRLWTELQRRLWS